MNKQEDQGKREESQTEEITDFTKDITEVVDDASDFVRRQASIRPYTTLASAFGIGYVLGGGVPKWALRALYVAGGRMIVNALITEFAGKPKISTEKCSKNSGS